MTHQLNRDIEHKTRGGRTLRREVPAGREEHSANRVAKFLRVSLDLFAERNFASVTIKDIAKALNVNTALIYYYFDSKTDLFRATIEYAVAGAFENVRALDNRSAAPPDIIAAWLSNHVNKYAEIHRFVKIALDFRGAHEADPDIASTIENFYVEERKLLSRVIREGIRQGLFERVDPNTDVANDHGYDFIAGLNWEVAPGFMFKIENNYFKGADDSTLAQFPGNGYSEIKAAVVLGF